MKIWNRVFWDFVLFLSVIVMPGWLAVGLALSLFFAFNSYYEIVFFGLFLDMLYGIGIGTAKQYIPVLFVVASFLFVILTALKKHLRSYE
jgi:hypothetical protein